MLWAVPINALKHGGEGGIRTHGILRYTAFRVRRTRPTMRPLQSPPDQDYRRFSVITASASGFGIGPSFWFLR